MINFLEETLDILELNNRSKYDVQFVTDGQSYMSFEDFEELANFEYYDGYGGNEIKLNLKVVGYDFWLERHEYDGSEWWEFKQQPKKPGTYNPELKLKDR